MSNICPGCGSKTHTLTFIVGIVKVVQYKCSKCPRISRESELTVPFSIPVMVREVERLRTNFPGQKTGQMLHALHFLEAKIHHHQLSALDSEAALRRRRLDMWERNFLRHALGEE